jgi:hypothetical protein
MVTITRRTRAVQNMQITLAYCRCFKQCGTCELFFIRRHSGMPEKFSVLPRVFEEESADCCTRIEARVSLGGREQGF